MAPTLLILAGLYLAGTVYVILGMHRAPTRDDWRDNRGN